MNVLIKQINNKLIETLNDDVIFGIDKNGKIYFYNSYPDILFNMTEKWIEECHLKETGKLDRDVQTYPDLYYKLDGEKFSDILNTYYINILLSYLNQEGIIFDDRLISDHFFIFNENNKLKCKNKTITILLKNYGRKEITDQIELFDKLFNK